MTRNYDVKKLVLSSMMIVIVIVLHAISMYFPVGILTLNLALIPIVIGAVLLGPKMGAILGLASALFVLLSGGANLFLGWNPFATWLIVLTKGILSGVIPGLIKSKLLPNLKIWNIVIAAFSSPIVNTGIFAIGCMIFFLSDIGSVKILLTGYIGVNFFIEVLVITVLTPTILKIVDIANKKFNINTQETN